MVDKNIPDQINKKDLELILEVNKKAIEVETEVAEQNEEIIDLLNDTKSSHEKMSNKINDIEEKVDEIEKSTDKIHKDIFKIQVLFVTGLLSLIVQVIQMFIKK